MNQRKSRSARRPWAGRWSWPFGSTLSSVLLVTFAAAACGGDGSSDAAAGGGSAIGATATAEMSPGEALYVTNCAMCHGPAGLGDGTMAASLPVEPPSLLDHLGHHPEDQLIRIIQNGVPPAMPPAPLDEDEVRLVVDYAWTLVPDSLVEGLREMQRMAEMGMDMTGMGMDDMGSGGADTPPDSMDHGAMGHQMPRDTTRRER